jgi:hypothetical protein
MYPRCIFDSLPPTRQVRFGKDRSTSPDLQGLAMAIDVLQEKTEPLTVMARRLPCLRNSRPVHASTLWRWATKGLRGVRLETARVGGVRVTSAEALRRFFAALEQLCLPSDNITHKSASCVDEELHGLGL